MMNADGVVTRTSPYEVKETIDRLIVFLDKHGATIYSRIDQQSEVGRAGKAILPLEFLMFGNPAVGGLIMDANPLAALDLPLKIVAWKDVNNTVKISYNDPSYIGKRYALSVHLIAPLDLTTLIDKALA